MTVRRDITGKLKKKSTSKALPALPTNRAFVVQLHRDANLEAGQFKGKVEHVVSMQSTHFESLEELVAFITQLCSSATEG